MQGSICSELLRRLAEHGPSLARAVALAAEVDCLAALALAAREGGYARPALTTDNVLHIQQGARLSLLLLSLCQEDMLLGGAAPCRAIEELANSCCYN